MGCQVGPGEAASVRDGVVTLVDGTAHPIADCQIAPDAKLIFSYEEAPAMDPAALPIPTEPAPAMAAPASVPTAATPAATIAQPDPTAQPLAGVGDLAKLGGDNPVAVIVLAGIAVLGGSAAWKFYNSKSSQAHEIKLKELELKSQSPSQSPPPCIVKHGELEAKIAALEGKVGQVERKTSTMSLDAPSPDELDERIVKLEKTVKTLTAKKAGAK